MNLTVMLFSHQDIQIYLFFINGIDHAMLIGSWRKSVVTWPWRRRSHLGKIGLCNQPPTYPRRLRMESIPDDLLVINAADPAALTRVLDLPDLAVTRLERPAWLGRL